MKHLLALLICGVMILGSSCRDGQREETGPSQMERVLAIHDEVMPKMGELSKLVGQLKERVDTGQGGEPYEKALKDLQGAHTSMMDWMKDFGDRFNADEILNRAALSEEKQQWLDQEEENIQAVKERINSSMARAKALLSEKE